MYDTSAILQCLSGRIGFYPNVDPRLPVVDADLLTSKSGKKYEDEHALITKENMASVCTEQDVTAYPSFDASKSYDKGVYVYNGGKLYYSLSTVPANSDITDTGLWGESSPFSAWLRKKVNASYSKVIDSMMTVKKLRETVKTLLENTALYSGVGNVNNKEIKEGRFVGVQLVLKKGESLNVQIAQLGTQFSDISGTPLTFYLYHTSILEPVMTVTASITKKISFQWHELQDLLLRYSSEETDVGGAWFFGYYEDDLPQGVQAINKSDFNYTSGPCSTCGSIGGSEFREWFRYVSVLPIAIPASALNDDRNIFDWDSAQYYQEGKTFGINLRLSVRCDITSVLCAQQSMLNDALSKQFAVDMMEEMAYTTRENRVEELTGKMALYELDDRERGGERGARTKLAKAIEVINFDFSELDAICMPCAKNTGLQYKSL